MLVSYGRTWGVDVGRSIDIERHQLTYLIAGQLVPSVEDDVQTRSMELASGLDTDEDVPQECVRSWVTVNDRLDFVGRDWWLGRLIGRGHRLVGPSDHRRILVTLVDVRWHWW